MTTIILIVLAAFFNSVMDMIKHHWHDSKFAKINNNFLWNFFSRYGWQNKYIGGDYKNGRKRLWGIKIHPAFLDAWHLSKSLMIICFILAIVIYKPIVHPVLDFVMFGLLFNFTFTLFYDIILRK